MHVALASKNPGKVREIAAILARGGIELIAPPADWIPPDETESTYRGNALLKARSLMSFTGLPVVADDSGIEVDALGGAPAHLSARYAGAGATDRANLDKLIAAVADVPEDRRRARYRCVAVLVTPAGDETVVEATVEGRLIGTPRGAGGFGYDPIFVPDEHQDRTMAELSPAEKDLISHRGKAFRALVPAVRALGAHS